jgi:hypothetical protein
LFVTVFVLVAVRTLVGVMIPDSVAMFYSSAASCACKSLICAVRASLRA